MIWSPGFTKAVHKYQSESEDEKSPAGELPVLNVLMC